MSGLVPGFFSDCRPAQNLRFTLKKAYIATVGASIATGYFAGRYISAVKGHAGTPSVSSHGGVKATEPDGDGSESDASSEAGDGDLTQVKPCLEEECKLVGFIQHPAPCPRRPTSERLRVGPRCTK